MPVLSSLRMLAIGTLLGHQKEKEVNWYLKPEFREKVLSQLTPQLDKIAQMIKHYAVSVCYSLVKFIGFLVIEKRLLFLLYLENYYFCQMNAPSDVVIHLIALFLTGIGRNSRHA